MGFAKDALGVRWWAEQEAIALSVRDHRRTLVRAGHSVGKTHGSAGLALWFLQSFPESKVITTAPTRRQVFDLLWREVRSQFGRAKKPLLGETFYSKLEIEPEWFATGFATKPDETDVAVTFQGYHAKHLLVILDEAPGVPAPIWDAVESLTTGKDNRILAIGNPVSQNDSFAKAEKSGLWNVIHISCLEHPNVVEDRSIIPGAVDRVWVDERVRAWAQPVEGVPPPEAFEWAGQWHVPSPIFESKVLGRAPRTEEDVFIPLAWVEAARLRELEPGEPVVFGVDVGQSAESVVAVRCGDTLAHIEGWRKRDTMETVGRVIRLARTWKPRVVVVDTVGIGQGVADRLKEQGLPIEAVNWGLPARDKERFVNQRAEWWWALRERFQEGSISIPDDDVLAGQLSSQRFAYTSKGQVKAEAKEEMARRGVDSPDRADAVVMAFAPVRAGGRKADFDFMVGKGGYWQGAGTWRE